MRMRVTGSSSASKIAGGDSAEIVVTDCGSDTAIKLRRATGVAFKSSATRGVDSPANAAQKPVLALSFESSRHPSPDALRVRALPNCGALLGRKSPRGWDRPFRSEGRLPGP